MHLLRILLSYKLTVSVLFITKHIVVGWNRWWIGKHSRHATALAPSCRIRVMILSIINLKGHSMLVGTWPWILRFRSNFAPMETLNARSKTCMRLDKVYSKLIKAEALKSLRTLHVSLNLGEAIRHCVAAWPWRELRLYKAWHHTLSGWSRCNLYAKIVTMPRLGFHSLA